MDDALVAGAVERNNGRSIQGVIAKEVSRSAEVAVAFLAGRPDELDRSAGAQVHAVNLLGDREHGGEAAPVVADAGSDDSRTVVAHTERGVARENGVEVRADDNRRVIGKSIAASNDIPDAVRPNICKTKVRKSARDPGAALPFLAGWRRDFGDGDLHADDRPVTRNESRTRFLESVVDAGRGGGARGHKVVRGAWCVKSSA
jgi:hypothetical protein